MEPGNWIAILGVGSGLAAFIVGLIQYAKAQRWKRAEFVAGEMRRFGADPSNELVMQMLDWNVRDYDLAAGRADPEMNRVVVTDETLLSALQPHDRRPAGFSRVEARIRELLDVFLGGLQRFDHFIESGLVERRDFDPYLRYWVALLGDAASGRKPPAVVHRIWEYIDYYGFEGVQRLLNRYGYDIRPPVAAPGVVTDPALIPR